MSTTPPSFSQAEYLEPVPAAEPAIHREDAPDPVRFTRSLLFGIGGALVGAALYAVFIGLTHINIGYLAIVVAWLVAKAMTTGSRGEGGIRYQVSALCLTYLAVSAARAALVYWFARHDDGGSIPLTAHNIFALAKYGLMEPFLRFQQSVGSALIGLFILFIGLRAAWRMTSGLPGVVRHPFAR